MKSCKKKSLIENHLSVLCINPLCHSVRIFLMKNYKSVKNHLNTVLNTMMKFSKKIPKWSHHIFQRIYLIPDLNFLSSLEKIMKLIKNVRICSITQNKIKHFYKEKPHQIFKISSWLLKGKWIFQTQKGSHKLQLKKVAQEVPKKV